MKKLMIVVTLFLSICACKSQPNKVSVAELQPYLGMWKGTLGYADYGTGRWTEIPSGLELAAAKNGKDILAQYFYPTETSHNSHDIMTITQNGRMLDGGRIVAKTKTSKQIKLVVEKEGNDNDKNALFRFTYLFEPGSLLIKKEVRFEGEIAFFVRNEYRLTK